MHQILLIIQVLVAVGLIGLVLLQQGKGADAGAAFGGGGAGSVFGSRGPATLLARMTAVFAVVFFLNSIGLAYIASGTSRQGQSVVERYQGAEREMADGEGIGAVQRKADGMPSDVPELPGDGHGGDP